MPPGLRRFPLLRSAGLAALRPTIFLFAVDTLANLSDYSFHVYLGRRLPPADFAVFQTVNSALLIAVTAFGVTQPVLARFVAEAEAREAHTRPLHDGSIALFRAYFSWSALAGIVLGLLVWFAADLIGAGLNVPGYAVRLGSFVVFLILLRPVVAGTLQGAQRFVAFGFTRLAYAAGRFLFAGIVLGLGAGLPAVIAALPVGQFLAVVSGLVLLGGVVWRRGIRPLPARRMTGGLQLAGWAFLAYGAFTALQNVDLLWVNRQFSADLAGAYAAAVLLRRVLILFPAAAAVVMYPRIVEQVAQGKLPDRLLTWTILLVSGSVAVLAGFYLAAGPAIVAFAFGSGYEAAGQILGTLGVAMLGYGIGSIWLNLFLATRPAYFVIFLLSVVLLQLGGLAIWHASLLQIALVFGSAGWAVALAGAVLYYFRLRPELQGAAGVE